MERRILAVDIIGSLEDNGFERCRRIETKYGEDSEIVYAKPLCKGSRKIIAVYTSCNQSGGAFIAKSSGKDAIRVAGIYINKEGKTKGLVKNKRVNRVGTNEAIVARLAARIVRTSSELQAVPKCEHCNAPTFLSRNNNLVCSETCWRWK